MNEVWRDVVGAEGFYEVSNLGNVRSIRTNFGNPRIRLLKPQITHDGYMRCSLSINGKKIKKHIAHMVLEAFVGPRPKGSQACHGPRGKSQNDLRNLRWDTPEANYADRTATGFMRGRRHHQCTITEEVARKIKLEAGDNTVPARDIALKYGTTVHVVRNIRNNKSWSWL